MAKYEWMNVEKTLLRMKISEDGSVWRETSVNDPDYVFWADQDGNTADTPAFIQLALDANAAASQE